MKKRYLIILFPIILIIIGIIIYFDNFISEKAINKKNNANIIINKKNIDTIIKNDLFSENLTKSDIKKIYGYNISDIIIPFGKESYLENKPDEYIIKEYNLNVYEELIDKYKLNVRKRFLDSMKYEYKENSNGNLNFKMIPWYYFYYSTDLNALTDYILTYINYDKNKIESNNDEYLAYEYQAKAISVMIMDAYLENYDNTDNDIINFSMKFNKENVEKNEMYNLLISMEGLNSEKANLKYGTEERQQERVAKYLDESFSNGIVDKTNPLKIR